MFLDEVVLIRGYNMFLDEVVLIKFTARENIGSYSSISQCVLIICCFDYIISFIFIQL